MSLAPLVMDAIHPMLFGVKWLDPQYLLNQYGGSLIWISIVIIFVECGLFFPFLPGDTLLFTLGLFIAGKEAAAGEAKTNIHVFGITNHAAELLVVVVVLSLAALAGNVAGYEIGRKIGPPLYRHDGRILKRKYLDNTKFFFDRHGDKALIIGRFVPFVRTFITLVAGVTRLDRRKFVTASIIGALLWVTSITLLGYFLGSVSFIKNNIDAAMLLLGVFTVAPLIFETIRHARHEDHLDTPAPEPVADPVADPS